MARTKSVVLTKDEKKTLIADLKAQRKAIKIDIKTFEKAVITATKSVNSATKELEKLEAKLAQLLEPAQ